jgi:hypothetical protein
MKNIKSIFLIGLLVTFTVPSIALASWWNPFSWFNNWGRGNNQTKVEVIEIATSTATTTPDNQAIIKAEVERQVQATLKAKADEQARIDAAVKAALEKQAVQTASQQQAQTAVPVPQNNGVSSTNYASTVLTKIKKTVNIHKSHLALLQDANNQLRSMSLTLAGYENMGGLYGQMREAGIKLANASIKVNNVIIPNVQEFIDYHQGYLNKFEAIPNLFISESDYNSISDKLDDALYDAQDYMDESSKSVNESLNQVMDALKYH